DRSFRDVQFRLTRVVCRFRDALLLPECGHAREVELRLRDGCLRLYELRFGCGYTSVSFFLHAARLVNNNLIVGRADTREHGTSNDGRSRLPRAQTSVRAFGPIAVGEITGH